MKRQLFLLIIIIAITQMCPGARRPLSGKGCAGADDHWQQRAGKKAMAYLNKNYGEHFFIPPADGGLWTPRSSSLTYDMFQEQEAVDVYPNPASHQVTLAFHLQKPVEEGVLAIYDLSNRLVEGFAITNSEQIITLDTRHWQVGLYLYKLNLKNEQHIGRFEIVH